jgi:hypothetical protein
MKEPIADGLDRVTVSGRTATVVRTLAEIDTDNLTKEVQEIGGTAIWWGVLYARALREVGRAKLRVGVVEGQTARALRVTLARDRGLEKVTEKIIEQEVTLHADVIAAKEEHIAAEERANMLRAVTFAIEQKQRTLTALTGAIAREFYANAPTGADDVLRTMQRGRTPDRKSVFRD